MGGWWGVVGGQLLLDSDDKPAMSGQLNLHPVGQKKIPGRRPLHVFFKIIGVLSGWAAVTTAPCFQAGGVVPTAENSPQKVVLKSFCFTLSIRLRKTVISFE